MTCSEFSVSHTRTWMKIFEVEKTAYVCEDTCLRISIHTVSHSSSNRAFVYWSFFWVCMNLCSLLALFSWIFAFMSNITFSSISTQCFAKRCKYSTSTGVFLFFGSRQSARPFWGGRKSHLLFSGRAISEQHRSQRAVLCTACAYNRTSSTDTSRGCVGCISSICIVCIVHM